MPLELLRSLVNCILDYVHMWKNTNIIATKTPLYRPTSWRVAIINRHTIQYWNRSKYLLCLLLSLRIMQPHLLLHKILFLASLSAIPHVSSIFLNFPSKFFLRVIFGLPCFHLPEEFHLRPFLGIIFCSNLNMCPSHLYLLCLTSVTIL